MDQSLCPSVLDKAELFLFLLNLGIRVLTLFIDFCGFHQMKLRRRMR